MTRQKRNQQTPQQTETSTIKKQKQSGSTPQGTAKAGGNPDKNQQKMSENGKNKNKEDKDKSNDDHDRPDDTEEMDEDIQEVAPPEPPENRNGSSTELRIRKGTEWQVVKRKYKKTKNNSANRRENLTEKDRSSHERAPTPERNNSMNYRYKTRVTVRMTIPHSPGDIYEPVLNAVQEFIQKLDDVEKDCALLPWRQSSFFRGKLDKKANFPSEFDNLKPYIHSGFWVPRSSKPTTIDIYPNFWIGHNCNFSELKDGLRDWMIGNKRQLYRNILQAEDPTEIGFLVYSTREMDAGALADDISETIGYAVGLKWKVINNGEKNLKKKSDNIKALIVETSARHRDQCTKALVKLYASTRKSNLDYPNGIRLRFCVSFRGNINPIKRRKAVKLRTRQKIFLETIRCTTSYSMFDIDDQYKDNLPSLRQMIMSIPVNGYPTVPLFHSVDLDYMGRGHVFQYSNEVAAEAECAINTLIPYLAYLFPALEDVSEYYFGPEEIQRCEGLKFDPVKGMVVDPTDTVEGVELELDDDLEGFNFNITKEKGDNDDAEGGKVERPKNSTRKFTGPADDDSVSTFGDTVATEKPSGKKKANLVSPARPTQDNLENAANDEVSVMSAGTMHTMKTLQTFQEGNDRKFAQLNEETTQIKIQLNDLVHLLRAQTTISPGDSVNPPNPQNSNAGSGKANTSGSGL